MWQCKNCKSVVDGDFTICWNCDSVRTNNSVENYVETEEDKKVDIKEERINIISSKSKLKHFIILFILTLIICLPMSINPVFWMYFPLGLCEVFNLDHNNANIALGWLLYLAYTFVICHIKEDELFKFAFYALFILILFNAKGCHIVSKGMTSHGMH